MNFIGKWNLENKTVCDDVIDFFNNSDFSKQNKRPGEVGNIEKGENPVREEVKKSIDLHIDPNNYQIPCINNYLTELQKVCEKYIKKYKWCDQFAPWWPAEGFNIQHYEPKGGYYVWHTERSVADFPMNSRHLVFMTYLNDVTDEGETEFYHQKLKIKPKKGLTVIWPADWTHVHRGVPSQTQEKYIITGWFNYCLPPQNK